MSTYGLLEHFEEVNDPKNYKHHKPLSGPVYASYKSLFKDKKLNKLWEKAENSGFTGSDFFRFFSIYTISLKYSMLKF